MAPPHEVDNHVDALPARRRLHLRGEVLGLVIDRVRGAARE